ncbi:MAG: shikimate kinase [Planctomycetaceae bacterium]|nr:shikimate kinase [Planctomycetaceae bacterium]
MPIIFIGYRGSGKSAVGACVADRLGWRFVDADVEIERRAGRTIREIFAEQGESHFRDIERQVLAELLSESDLVIAAGGGAILSAETRERLKCAGPVIYLKVSPGVAEQRIASDVTTSERRPALMDLPRRAEIETTMAARALLYEECATITLDADAKTVSALADEVMRLLPAEYRREAAT